MSTQGGTSIETYTGKYVDYLDPRPEDICIEDIARGLAYTARFAGQSTRLYTVAEHSVRVMQRVPTKLQLAALLHDAHEAYMCDWPTPLKNAVGPRVFDDIAFDLDMAIARHFDFCVVDFVTHEVKAADRYMLRREAATLKYSHGRGDHWGNYDHYVPLAGICWEPDEAERRFLDAFHSIGG